MQKNLLKLLCVVLLGISISSALPRTVTLVRAEGTPPTTQEATGQKVKIKAADGLEIVGLFYPVAEGKAPAVLLLHDGVNSKEQWLPYIPDFTGAGYNVLVVDQRGVGETGKSPTAGNSAAMQDADLPALMAWLRQQPSVDPDAIAPIGARLGANVALRACANDEQCHAVVALTPSTDFFGIKTGDAMKAMTKDKAVFLVASQLGENGGKSLKALQAEASDNINFMTRLYGMGFQYGTDMLREDPSLMPMVLLWLKTYNHS